MTASSAGASLVNALADAGARRFYSVPGESFLEVLEALRNHPSATLISTRHESGAAFMAEADAKLSGVPAVAAATRAPGAANLAIGVHTAWHDSTPMVALLGQVEADLLGCDGAFQGIDLEAFYRPITKWTATLRDPKRAAELADEAVARATSGRPGPVAIVLPTDVLGKAVPPEPTARVARATTASPNPDRAALEELRRRLEEARSAVMIVGGRCREQTRALIELAERFGLGVYSAFRRQDHFPNEHPRYLGHLTLATPKALLEPLRQADVVLALGCRLSEITTQRFVLPTADCFFAHLDASVDPIGPARVPDLALACDVVAAMAALLEMAPANARPLLENHRQGHQRYLDFSAPPARSDASPMHPAQVVAAMADILPADSIVTNDAGNFSVFLHRYWRYRFAKTQLAPTSGAMGYAVPAAVAAGLVQRERVGVAVAGDGGFLMTGMEVETALRYGVKLLVVVMRNGLYGTIAMHQARRFGALAGARIGDVDPAQLARGLGAMGLTASTGGELREALRVGLETPGPVVIDAAIDPDVLTPEFRLSQAAVTPF